MEFTKKRRFANGIVYALETNDGYPIETTDTFLPYYTKDAIGRKQNKLYNYQLGDRTERWMIGVSVMSGCPVKCQFCATGQLPKYRNLFADEITEQVRFILQANPAYEFKNAKEHKINYTRMGEPFLCIDSVRKAIEEIEKIYPGTHHYVSTIGIKGSDFSWIQENITLQISLHACTDERRNELIPFRNKMSIEELGQIRTRSKLKTTLNLTLVDEKDFNIDILKKHFPPEHFFIKLSPINPNAVSEAHGLGSVIDTVNLA
jgi:adenine C2-methylase RlmN of 23S rRNA A2503 and tRNA A37